MGRPLRASVGGYIYHALNRGNGRGTIFHKQADYQAFERVLCEAQEHVPGLRLLAYCLMPNHWHLVLWPTADGELSDFLHWLTLTHTQRWHVHCGNVGGGHLYQGRFKSFPMQNDEHFLTVCRYVERNALRAGLVKRAQDWRWGSLSRRLRGAEPERPILSRGPLPWPSDWLRWVNAVQSEGELAAIRRCAERGQPYGGQIWTKRTAGRLGLASTLRGRGRPKKEARKGS
jgi:REP-associated tyrosine transposase